MTGPAVHLEAGLILREAAPQELATWDANVRRFPNHRVVHTRAWIESLRAAGCGQPLYLLFERYRTVVGCLPGLLTSVAGRRVFGSPLAGWQTVSMGPAFDPAAVTTGEMIDALVPYLEEWYGVELVELMHDGLDDAEMRTAGFSGAAVGTYRCRLIPGDEDATLKQFKESARRNIKRAERLGLEVRFDHDERFVDEHYDQLREVFLRGGHVVSFTRARVAALFEQMRAAGNLLAPSVWLPGGRVCIATGMWTVEGPELLLWSWSHRTHYRWYRPTELMTWAVIKRALAAGCDTFDLMGRGEFKSVFGATPDDSKMRWVYGRQAWMVPARRVAESAWRWQQTVRGRAVQTALRIEGRLVQRRADSATHALACVLGDVDLVRALALAKVPCAVCAPPGDAARYSRAARTRLPWLDTWRRAETMVEALVAFGQAQPEPPVLFYEDDRTLLLVSRWREALRQGFRFVVPDAELVEQLVDKARFQALAERLKLPVPAARVLDPEDPPTARDELDFPLALKPLTRNAAWKAVSGGAKALVVPDQEAFDAAWRRVAAARITVLAQRLVPGSEAAIESYHAYVDERGQVAGEFTGRKIRTWPTTCGDSSALEITAADDVATLGRSVLKKLGLKGVAKLDFKRAPDGALHLLEVNPRFTLWCHPGAVAGVNLPALVYGDLLGLPRPAATKARAGVQWCKVWKDGASALAAGMPAWHWLRWALRADAKSALAWDDPLPLFGAALWRGFRRPRPAPVPRVSGPHPTLSPALRRQP